MAPEGVATFLGQTAALRPCAPAVLARVAPHLEQRDVPRGQLILQPGLAAASVGFLYSGRASVRVVNAASGTDTRIEDLAPGDSFGEVGLLLGGANPLSVVAEDDSTVLFLRKEHFEQILNNVPGVAQAVARALSSRFVKVSLIGAQAGGRPPSSAAMPTMPIPPPGAPSLRKGELRFVDVASFSLTPKVLEMIPAKLIHQHRILPLELRDKALVVGLVNPRSEEAIQEIRRVLHSVDPEVVAISVDDWSQTIVRLKLDMGDRSAGSAQGKSQQKVVYSVEHRKEAEKGQVVIGEEITSLLDRILLEAVDRGASDIHIEPEASAVRVRYRVQGMLVERKELVPLSFASPLSARIKVLSELDITERRIPQDGRIAAQLGRRDLSFRVSTLATGRGGEKIVMRLLDPTDVMRPLDQIFVDGQVAELVNRSLSVPHGAIFVAGPTGSGKSSTLYSMLNQRKISRPDNNIVTVEDPVEFVFPGITQHPVHAKIGLDYPTILRALMRQDPDVVMIGELRERESSAIAIEAALTGHLVLTSIHGSTANAVLQRLGHFGISPVLLSQALNIIVVQRLAPRLCANCVRDDDVSPAMLENLRAVHLIAPSGPPPRLPRPVGCEVCDRTGRKGRVAVIEAMSLQEDMRAVLASGAQPAELVQKAAQANQFFSFSRSAKMLMARNLLAPADAMLVVAE